MSRLILVYFLAQLSVINYSQIIADHNVVDLYDDIPSNWIDSVKTMMISFPGESHSVAYKTGMALLEDLNSTYACNLSTAEPYTDQYVRVDQYGPIGEYVWFTWYAYPTESRPDAKNYLKSKISSYSANGHPFNALGFGWCSDMIGGDGTETVDPLYDVHWYGRSAGGPEGNIPWGIDDEDFAITGNTVSLETYFDAMEDYIAYCASNSPTTKMIFTTGPVNLDSEWSDERGYQGHIKHEAIREYVNADASRILFDYADILCYDNDGSLSTQTWDGHTFPSITLTNYQPIQTGHISNAGAIRLAKAQWWMLARIAGWDGNFGGPDTDPPTVPSGLKLTSSSISSVSISWIASTDNVGVAGYNISREGEFLETTTNLSYTDNTVSSCTDYSYTVTAFDAAGNESAQSLAFVVNNCAPDLTSTITLSPNVAHGITIFDLIVRVTELNSVNTNGAIIIHIPKDQLWDLSGSFDPSLTLLGATSLDNNDWAYSEDLTNHIFSSSTTIVAGGFSTFGFRISFDPGSSMGVNPITSQVVSGGGGEVQVSNNSDSERLDYFQN